MQIVTMCHCLAYRRIHRTCQSRLVQPLPVVTEPQPFALPGASKVAKFFLPRVGGGMGILTMTRLSPSIKMASEVEEDNQYITSPYLAHVIQQWWPQWSYYFNW